MRIAIDARLVAGTNTGDSSYWTCLVDAFGTYFPEIEFCLFSNTTKPKNVPLAPNCSWHTITGGSSRWWSLATFPLAARKLKCDITHAQYSISPLAKNSVTTIHDISFLINPEWFSPKDRKLLQATIPLSAKLAKRIITVSETSRQEIVRFLPATREKVRVAHNATPYWIQRVDKETALLNIKKLGIDTPFLLTVGTNWARKNMQLAIDATRDLGISLVVTGKQGEKLTGSHCRAVGYVDNATLCSLYSACSLYLAPSFHEGFGIPILEAFRCGAPVICGYGGAMPEVAGTAGIVKRDYDSKSWRETIQDMLSNPSKLEAMQQAGIRREAGFTWKASAERHIEVYREVMSEK